MIIHSKSDTGDKAFKEKEGALIGLSIRNSYFKDENLHELISWAKDNFKHVNIMCPDQPAVHTLRSLGYDEKKAKEKANLACNNLENKCKRIIEELGIAGRSKIIRWDDLEKNEKYNSMYRKMKELYEKDSAFRNDARGATKQVIEHHGTELPMEEAIDIGIEFFLKELALILNAADILGIPKSAYIYHKEMPVLEKLLNGEYSFAPPKNNGYIICETDSSIRDKETN